MKLHIVTIVLDGMPFIASHLQMLNQLHLHWTWHVVEGATRNVRDTNWCQPQEPRLSVDGTTEYLNTLAHHPRVRIYRNNHWDGKVAMVNAPLPSITEEAVLMQMDVDEIWKPDDIELITNSFNEKRIGSVQCRCRYFLGPNIITVGQNCYGNNPGEWLRFWRFFPGSRFITHEPPALQHEDPNRKQVRFKTATCTFDHYAYLYDFQVAYKEKFYGYPGALEQWQRLQANTVWPVKLKDFLPWVDNRVQATTVYQ